MEPRGRFLSRAVRTILIDNQGHFSREDTTMATPFICPVCGFPNLTEEPRHADGGGSDEISPSCGFQFGYDDDDRGISFVDWRRDWIKRGMPWSSQGIEAPVDWNPDIQLRNIQ